MDQCFLFVRVEAQHTHRCLSLFLLMAVGKSHKLRRKEKKFVIEQIKLLDLRLNKTGKKHKDTCTGNRQQLIKFWRKGRPSVEKIVLGKKERQTLLLAKKHYTLVMMFNKMTTYFYFTTCYFQNRKKKTVILPCKVERRFSLHRH